MHQDEYIEELKAHRFVWCPPGNGHDTYVPLPLSNQEWQGGMLWRHLNTRVICSSSDMSCRCLLWCLFTFVPELTRTIVRADARRHRMYEALQHGTVPVVMFHEVTAFRRSLSQFCPAPPYCQTPHCRAPHKFLVLSNIQVLALATRKYH